jgi:hypothetical protein
VSGFLEEQELFDKRTRARPELAREIFSDLSILCAPGRRTGEEPRKGDLQMQYLLLIYGVESHWDTLPEGEKQSIYREYMALSEDLRKTGKYIGGNELQPTSTATTVRIRNGKRNVTDGPFAETKEQLGGYYLVEARDLDEAIELAARIPSGRWGSIEVRPINPH